MRKRMFAALTALALLAASALGMAGCATEKQPLQETVFLFDTVCTITLYDTNDASILQDVIALCERYDALWSLNDEASDIYRINHAQGQSVEVAPETAQVLREAQRYAQASNGLFDVTIAPLSTLWAFRSDDPHVPDASAIDQALGLVNYNLLQIAGNTVTLPAGAGVDIGGIAKGAIADAAAELLRTRGVQSAIINLGGNVMTLGSRPDGAAWRVGIQQPFGAQNSIAGRVEVRDASVVTAGVYERAFEQDGKLYHHILDPATGYPSDKGVLSVSILSQTSMQGDALSTTCFLMGREAGLAYVESLPGVECLYLMADGTYSASSGLAFIDPSADFVPAVSANAKR
nr:FAD:protein FMN transferase [Maliibacterium massiliense]